MSCLIGVISCAHMATSSLKLITVFKEVKNKNMSRQRERERERERESEREQNKEF